MTLVLIHEHPKILLGMKKKGFGAGRWNGFGGKVEAGEEVHRAAKRELMEEAGVEAADVKRVGVLDFSWAGKPEILEVHIFRGENVSGSPKESDEMRPQWFHIDEIPFNEMWPDDKYWMPLFLAGKNFKGKFVFNDKDEILEHSLQEVGEA